MIPTGLPNLAFVGGEVSTFNNILTHGLQAAWLKRLLTGEFALPPRGRMARARARALTLTLTLPLTLTLTLALTLILTLTLPSP